MSLGTILIFLIILLVLVIVHEFGHFIAAKLTGMRVDEFAFGFPPRIWSVKKGETNYSFNAIPLGGYVAIYGENGEKDDVAKKDKRAFGNRPWWAQLITLVAGVTMNMILAWIIFVAISFGTVRMSVNDPLYGDRVKQGELLVADSSPESPAYKAGLIPGSVITKIKSGGDVFTGIDGVKATDFIHHHIDNAFSITYIDLEGRARETTVAAVYGLVPEKKAIGVYLDTVGDIHTSFFEALQLGTERTTDMTLTTFDGLRSLVASLRQGDNVIESLSGPIGLAKIVGRTSEYGYKALLTLVAVLSINLAIFNALPLPALDGGRMIIVIGETITRRKFPFKYMSIINSVSFVLLLILLLVVSIKDITG
jgi:regulator of sigma E protease